MYGGAGKVTFKKSATESLSNAAKLKPTSLRLMSAATKILHGEVDFNEVGLTSKDLRPKTPTEVDRSLGTWISAVVDKRKRKRSWPAWLELGLLASSLRRCRMRGARL